MKQEFFNAMHDIMEENDNVFLIFVGLGYPRLEEFSTNFPQRVINTEASEQAALDIAVGLAYEGKIPVVYTITPFLLRGFETIRTFINHENLHVIMVGAGADDDYSKTDGFSHEAGDIPEIMATQKNIVIASPADVDDMRDMLASAIENNSPVFLNIRR